MKPSELESKELSKVAGGIVEGPGDMPLDTFPDMGSPLVRRLDDDTPFVYEEIEGASFPSA